MIIDPPGLDRLCIHTITNKPWSGLECIQHYAKAGVGGITFWRYHFDRESPEMLGQAAREAGLEVVSLARGGFFPAIAAEERRRAIEENIRAIDEAATLGAPSLVMVCGAVPGQSPDESRDQIRDGIGACLDHAAGADVILAIEPLHPMYADDRSAINTVAQANEICRQLDHHTHVGIAVDVYHTWWDPDLRSSVGVAGRDGNLTAYHVCDWKTPTADMLNDRGLMGEGCIDLRGIRQSVETAGFRGFCEVEIFSELYWAEEQSEYLNRVIEAFERYC